MSKLIIIEILINGFAALAVSSVLIGLSRAVKRACARFLRSRIAAN